MTNPASPTPTTQAAKPRKPRYPATVTRVRHLTPRMVRVTFSSPELADFGWNGPAAHIKLIFGGTAALPAGAAPGGTPPMHATSGGGAPVASATQSAPGAAPGGEAPRPTMRTYTPRRFDRNTRELEVDFVLHGEGPAATWASQAAAGQSLSIAGPGRNYVIDPAATSFVLAGDDSAIPAIATILEHLPAAAHATVFLEVVDAADEHRIHAGSNATIRWLHRGEDPTKAGTLLESTLRDFAFPADECRVYVACEAAAMRRIRRYLLTERGMQRDHIVSRGYWKLGETDHPDGDYGQDV